MTKKPAKPETTAPDTKELDESQLEEVAGGFNPQPEPPAVMKPMPPLLDAAIRFGRRIRR